LNKQSYDKKINILDWSVISAIIIMLLMVYVPQNIWAEEEKHKNNRRKKMEIISDAEDFYFELTGKYTTNVKELFLLVESAMDSLIADSTFIGKQKININNLTYDIILEKDFHIRVDTTFSYSENISAVVIDTTYTIGVKNEETSIIDTFAINSKHLLKYKKSILFDDIYSYETNERVEMITNYLRKKFHLKDSLIYCPISDNNLSKKFILEIMKTEHNEPIFKITSPIKDEDKEWRYGIFRYYPGKKEIIKDGIKSWASN